MVCLGLQESNRWNKTISNSNQPIHLPATKAFLLSFSNKRSIRNNSSPKCSTRSISKPHLVSKMLSILVQISQELIYNLHLTKQKNSSRQQMLALVTKACNNNKVDHHRGQMSNNLFSTRKLCVSPKLSSWTTTSPMAIKITTMMSRIRIRGSSLQWRLSRLRTEKFGAARLCKGTKEVGVSMATIQMSAKDEAVASSVVNEIITQGKRKKTFGYMGTCVAEDLL